MRNNRKKLRKLIEIERMSWYSRRGGFYVLYSEGTTSLAVQKANYAVMMYKNVGFEIVDENEEE